MDVGHVTALLGARFDDTEFEKYDRHLAQVKREAARKEAYKAKLGADFNPAAFRRYESEVRKAERAAKTVKPAQLKGDYDGAGFRKYEDSVRKTDRAHGDLVRGTGRVRSGLGSLFIGGAGVAGAAVGFAALTKGVTASFQAFKESEQVARQTGAVLKSTGGAAGVTADQVGALADALSRKTGVDDETIQSSENVLLTFTKLRNETGKGNDVFDQATKAALDMSVALHKDLGGSSIQVGKALNNPIKGITALSRAGVSFTAKQKDQIKTLTESGHRLDAQKIILGELTKEFGGSAAATATSSKRLRVTFGNLQEDIGRKLSPAFERAAGGLDKFIKGMSSGRGAGGRFATAIREAFQTVRRVVDTVGRFLNEVLSDNRRSLNRLEKAFQGLVGPVRTAINRIVAAFKKAFSSNGSLGQDIRSIIKQLVSFVTFFYTKIQIPIIRRILPGIVTAFEGFARIIRGIVQIIAGILTLNFKKAWEGVKNIFGGAMEAVWGILRAGTAPLRAAASAIGGAIASAFSSAWNGIVRTAAGFVNAIIDILNKIPGVNIGHVSWGGPDTTGIENYRPSRQRHGGQAYREGGKVTTPIAIMGEDAPQHPEWVIPTHPAYRKRAVALWQMAARELGIPGFAVGGVLKDAARRALGPVGDVASGAVSAVKGGWQALAKLLPQIPGGLPGEVLGDAFRAAKDKAIAYLKAKVTALVPHFGGSARGPAGIGSFDGVPMANWVIGALNYARGRGVSFHPTSGFRSQAHQDAIRAREPRAATVSEHSGTQYPHGAVDFGGFDDPVAYGVKMAVVAATRGYKYPLLAPAGFHDDGHASGTGHRMGGILGLLGGPLGGEPLGDILGFRRGGRHKPKKPKGPALSAKANRGIRRSVARGERGIKPLEDAIQTMEREYGQLDRRFGLTDEQLLVEHDDGSITVDERAQTARLGELAALKAKREAILRKVGEYRRKVAALRKALSRGIRRLKRALKAAKGKARTKERGRYRTQIATYGARVAELEPVFRDLGLDLEDQRIDLSELGDEIGATLGARGTPATPVEAPPDIDVGGVPDVEPEPEPAPEPETVTVGPTVEEIAQAAAEQLTAFNENRADLFATFGQNFNRAGDQFVSATQQAAGARYFGAVPDDQRGGVLAGAGGGGVVVTNHFQAPPPDPHAWSQGIGWELRQAI